MSTYSTSHGVPDLRIAESFYRSTDSGTPHGSCLRWTFHGSPPEDRAPTKTYQRNEHVWNVNWDRHVVVGLEYTVRNPQRNTCTAFSVAFCSGVCLSLRSDPVQPEGGRFREARIQRKGPTPLKRGWQVRKSCIADGTQFWFVFSRGHGIETGAM